MLAFLLQPTVEIIMVSQLLAHNLHLFAIRATKCDQVEPLSPKLACKPSDIVCSGETCFCILDFLRCVWMIERRSHGCYGKARLELESGRENEG
jgi:hypothetical protein